MNKIKKISLLALVLIVAACGAREEKKAQKNNNADEVVVVNYTDLEYPNSDEYALDSTKTEYEVTETTDENINNETTETTDKKSETTETTTLDEKEATTEMSETSTDKEENIMVETKEGLKKESDAPIVTEEIKKSATKRYYIIGGSFKEFNNAENMDAFFKKEGYKSLVLAKVAGYNRVAVSSYLEEANARNAIKKLRTKYTDKKIEFWLLLK